MTIEYGDKKDILKRGTRIARVPIKKIDGTLSYVEEEVLDNQFMLETEYLPSERPTSSGDGLSYYRFRQGGQKGFTQDWMNGNHGERAMHFDVLYELGKWNGRMRSIAMIGGGVFAMPVVFNMLPFTTKHVFEINPAVKKWNENKNRNAEHVVGWEWFMGDYHDTLPIQPDRSYDVIYYDADEPEPDTRLLRQKLTLDGILLGVV